MSYLGFSEDDGRKRHPIRPDHIKADRGIGDTFGSAETEASAAAIVRFCQAMGAWVSFTQNDIEAFLHGPFFPNDLVDQIIATRENGRLVVTHPYLYKTEDGRFHLTHEFICRCFGGAPRHHVLEGALAAA